MSIIDELRWKEYKVLDHGHVCLVDVMGGDQDVVDAARISYGAGTRSVSDDRTLIRYLMRHFHTTPFEMVEFKFRCKMPIFVARQWIRHRTANVNEISGRYSEMKDEFYVPDILCVTKQNPSNKQGGSNELVEDPESQVDLFREEAIDNFESYSLRINSGMRKELARINLPLSTYTEWYWKIDLHNLFHFLRLRLDSHAQYEIRVYAEVMAEIVKACVPLCWEAFEDYRLNAVTFSSAELAILRPILRRLTPTLPAYDGLSKREAEEFNAKVVKIVGEVKSEELADGS